jgi:hypothetical protein
MTSEGENRSARWEFCASVTLGDDKSHIGCTGTESASSQWEIEG